MNKKFAFVFPGQGSQNKGMLFDLAQQFSLIKKTFDEASEALSYDLWNLVKDDPEERLNETVYTQPALLAAGYAIWRVWQSEGGQAPCLLAGHSLGEYTALVCADSIEFKEAVALVEKRAQFMQEAVPLGEGGMAAVIGLDYLVVEQLCESAAQSEIISVANFNAPGQIVVSGHVKALKRLVSLAKEKGARLVKILPVSIPSHSPLMKKAALGLSHYIEKIRIKPPRIPILHNVDTEVCGEVNTIKEKLIEQLYSPVQWTKTVQKMAEQSIPAIFECGPGKILLGLNKRIAPALQHFAIYDDATLREGLNEARRA